MFRLTELSFFITEISLLTFMLRVLFFPHNAPPLEVASSCVTLAVTRISVSLCLDLPLFCRSCLFLALCGFLLAIEISAFYVSALAF